MLYKEWIDQYGCEPRENKYNEVETKLIKWAYKQRQKYKNGRLTENRILDLQSIGFRFENIVAEWGERLQEYKEWIDQYGYEPKNTKKNSQEYKLASWANVQRQKYKNGMLTENRILDLQSIGFRF